jgi:hypothetical protein
LKAELFNDAIDAAGADRIAGLAHLLRDDGGGGIGIEEAVTDDLSRDLFGAHVVGLRPWFAALQGRGALLTIALEQLKIPLHAETVFGCGLSRAQSFALTLNEHGEALGDFVVGEDGELTAWPNDHICAQFNVHGTILSRGMWYAGEHGALQIEGRGDQKPGFHSNNLWRNLGKIGNLLKIMGENVAINC